MSQNNHVDTVKFPLSPQNPSVKMPSSASRPRTPHYHHRHRHTHSIPPPLDESIHISTEARNILTVVAATPSPNQQSQGSHHHQSHGSQDPLSSKTSKSSVEIPEELVPMTYHSSPSPDKDPDIVRIFNRVARTSSKYLVDHISGAKILYAESAEPEALPIAGEEHEVLVASPVEKSARHWKQKTAESSGKRAFSKELHRRRLDFEDAGEASQGSLVIEDYQARVSSGGSQRNYQVLQAEPYDGGSESGSERGSFTKRSSRHSGSGKHHHEDTGRSAVAKISNCSTGVRIVDEVVRVEELDTSKRHHKWVKVYDFSGNISPNYTKKVAAMQYGLITEQCPRF